MRLGSKKMKEGMCQRKGNVAERKLTHSGQADRWYAHDVFTGRVPFNIEPHDSLCTLSIASRGGMFVSILRGLLVRSSRGNPRAGKPRFGWSRLRGEYDKRYEKRCWTVCIKFSDWSFKPIRGGDSQDSQVYYWWRSQNGHMNLGLRYLFWYTNLFYWLYMHNLFNNYIVQRSVLPISAMVYKGKKVSRQACA